MKILIKLTILIVSQFFVSATYADIPYYHFSDSISEAIAFDRILKESSIAAIEVEGGEIVSYVCERGDSWERIAKLTGMQPWEIQSLNPYVDFPYTGAELWIPHYPINSRGAERAIVTSNEQYSVALSQVEAENWKDAIKIYDKIINTQPSLTAYYLRGISKFNMGKFKEARNDFSYVVDNDTYAIFADAREKYVESDTAWEQKKNERSAKWMNIAASILQFGAEVTGVILTAQQMESNGYYSSLGTPYASFQGTSGIATQLSDPNYLNNVYTNILTKTFNDYNQQLQSEYNMVRVNYQRIGSDLSFDEFMSLKAQAASNISSESNYSFEDQTTNDKYDYRSRSQDILNRTVGEKCGYCKGSKKCHACNGTKVASGFGLDHHCNLCNDSGDCPVCNGTGLASWNRN